MNIYNNIYSSFKNCHVLNGSLTIGNSVETIGVDAFSGCYNLTGDLVIPDHVTTIGERAFDNCGFNGSLILGNSVTTIGDFAFELCGFSGDLVIPNSVVSIGQFAFYGFYQGLLTMGNSIVTVGDGAFSSCGFTGTLTLPNSITTIGSWAFYEGDNGGFTGSLVVPSSVIAIGSKAFGSSFEQIVVDATNPMYDSRDNCNAIIETNTNKLINGCNNTTIPSSITAIGEYAMAYCELVVPTCIPNSVVSIEEGAFYRCFGLQLPLPNSICSIGPNAFGFCGLSGLLNIPKSVTSIGDTPFHGNIGIEGIVVESENLVFDSRNSCNAIVETATNTLIVGCKNTIIPGTVRTIGDGAFYYCWDGLTSIEIPNSITEIGDYAFKDCLGLTGYLVLPNSVTKIGASAFCECQNLTGLVIGNSVNEIGSDAFAYCFVDTIVSLNPSPPTLFGDIFGYDDVVNQLIVSCGNKDAYVASDWFNYFNAIEEDCNSYSIGIVDAIGGVVSISMNSALLGETILVSYITEPGYELDYVTICKADDETRVVPFYDNSFVMPNFDVVVKPSFHLTSVNENNIITASVYPNPTVGLVRIEAEDFRQLSVFNLIGQKVFANPVNGDEIEFDLSSYEPGVYLIRIETDNGITTKRVVLTK